MVSLESPKRMNGAGKVALPRPNGEEPSPRLSGRGRLHCSADSIRKKIASLGLVLRKRVLKTRLRMTLDIPAALQQAALARLGQNRRRFGCGWSPVLAVAHQLHRYHRAQPAHIAD